jgi:hypothetical protein
MRHIGVLLPVVFAFLVGAAPASAWTWPVEGPVMQQFSFGGDPYAGGQHRGIDVGAASNAPVRAPAAGLVSFAGSVPGGGLTVTIRTDDGYAVTLVHLGTVAVGRGQQVLEGDVVGAVGPSGEAEQASPYVHLGIRVAADEHGYVDPLTVLPARPGASGAPADVAPADGAAAGEAVGAPQQEQPSPGAGPEHPSAAAQTEASSEQGANTASPAPSESPAGTVSVSSEPGAGAGQAQTAPGVSAGTVVSDQGGEALQTPAGSVRGSPDSAGGAVIAAAGADLPAAGLVPVRVAHPSASRGAVQEAAETRPSRASGPANGAEIRHRRIAIRRGGQGARPQVMKPDASPAAPIGARDEDVQTTSSAGRVESAGRTDRDLLLGKAAALAAVLAGAALLLWHRAGGAHPAPAADPAKGSPGEVVEAKAAVDRHPQDHRGIEIGLKLDSSATRAQSPGPASVAVQSPGMRLGSVDDLARAA